MATGRAGGDALLDDVTALVDAVFVDVITIASL